MKILGSHFVQSFDDDLSHIEGLPIQLSFYARATFRTLDHHAFLQRLSDQGVTVESVHAPAADVIHTHGNEFIEMLTQIRNIYGVKVITVHPQRGDKRQIKSHYRKVEKEISKLGVIIAYETFDVENENRKWITQVEEMHRYFDVLKYPFLGVTYDFTHSESGKNLREIRHFNHHISAIHFSDALRDRPLDPNEKHQHYALGFGDYPIIEFLELLERINYDKFVILEYLPKYFSYLREDTKMLSEYVKGNKNPLLQTIAERRSRDAD